MLYRVQFLSLGAVGAVSAPCLDSSCEGPGALGAFAQAAVWECGGTRSTSEVAQVQNTRAVLGRKQRLRTKLLCID